MALITCPDCGKQVSDKAPACPNCGCPIKVAKHDNRVRIQIPNTEALGGQGIINAFIAKDAYVRSGARTLWEGKHGTMAIFEISAPAEITVDLGKWANPTTGKVVPGHRYQLVQDQGVHWKATFRLSEVDVIDSGF